jgi:hypothetical protein
MRFFFFAATLRCARHQPSSHRSGAIIIIYQQRSLNIAKTLKHQYHRHGIIAKAAWRSQRGSIATAANAAYRACAPRGAPRAHRIGLNAHH